MLLPWKLLLLVLLVELKLLPMLPIHQQQVMVMAVFVGDNGVTWTYVQARDDQGYEANGTGLMLRRLSSGSKVTSSTISGGIGNFTCSLVKAYTGSGNRQVELFINGVSKGTSIAWDNTNVQVFTIENINIAGDVSVEIRNITEKQVVIDDISWTCYSTLSTEEFTQNLFSIYPNPTVNNNVTIHLNDTNEIKSVEFYNTLGQLIISVTDPTIKDHKIEVENIPSGIYLVKIKNNTAFSTKRLIVN